MDGGNGGVRRRASGREIGEELCGGEAGARIAEIGSDFGEGYEDEGALREAGMRNFKAGLRKDEIAVEENVEVEGAGGDSRGGTAVRSTRSVVAEGGHPLPAGLSGMPRTKGHLSSASLTPSPSESRHSRA